MTPASNAREYADDVWGRLTEPQRDTANALCRIILEHGLAYAAMYMRTGKTPTGVAIAGTILRVCRLRRPDGDMRLLVITRKRNFLEFEKWLSMTSIDYDLINFESAHKIDASLPYYMVIVDEAHALGAFPKMGKHAKAIRRAVHHFPLKAAILYMSGTPTPESYAQIFHQFHITPRSPFAAYPNFYRWADDFVNKKDKRIAGGVAVVDYSDANERKIRLVTDRYFVSLGQEEAGLKVPVEEIDTYWNPPAEVVAAYRTLEDNMILEIDGHEPAVADTTATLMTKLMQVAGGFVYAGDKQARDLAIISREKAHFITGFAQDRKVAIMYKFEAEFEMLREAIDDVFGPGKYTTSPEEFQAMDEIIFLGQVVANREAVNLSTADEIIVFSPDFSATTYLQLRARLQNYERVKPAIVRWVLTLGTMQDQVLARVRQKRSFTAAYYRALRLK